MLRAVISTADRSQLPQWVASRDGSDLHSISSTATRILQAPALSALDIHRKQPPNIAGVTRTWKDPGSVTLLTTTG
jgi:hypothetical protein